MAPWGTELCLTGVNADRVVDGRIVEHAGGAHLLGPPLEAGSLGVGNATPE